jgi:hypothetical protein
MRILHVLVREAAGPLVCLEKSNNRNWRLACVSSVWSRDGKVSSIDHPMITIKADVPHTIRALGHSFVQGTLTAIRPYTPRPATQGIVQRCEDVS